MSAQRSAPLGDGGPEGWARPIVKESLADIACRTIRTALMEGHLKPGEVMHLRPMSARFGISVTPMREALVRLVSANALAMDERGTVVVPELTQPELREIWEIRAEMEARAAGFAAARVTPDEIARLRALNDTITAAIADKDFAGAVRGNTRFHLMLSQLAGKPVLAELIESLWIRTGPILWHAYDRQAPRWTPSRHLQIIEALENRDSAMAADSIRKEILKGAEGFVRFATPEEPPPES
ncbi:GntR family transcriptional regulator [Oceanicola sp. 22II-s10i]|uniref:GntR family transcriptional regulator n=1 Tax=Oceanicola sp. 22II-s10i TaxID=1317116 RepID=UPI000B527D25|nr:GntR family transcriptional regulator [Oceanicola sp. 22II-s10i]